MFYAIDIEGLVRRGTAGAFAGDPTIPFRPSRLTLLRRRLRTRRMAGVDGRAGTSCTTARPSLAEQRAA